MESTRAVTDPTARHAGSRKPDRQPLARTLARADANHHTGTLAGPRRHAHTDTSANAHTGTHIDRDRHSHRDASANRCANGLADADALTCAHPHADTLAHRNADAATH